MKVAFLAMVHLVLGMYGVALVIIFAYLLTLVVDN